MNKSQLIDKISSDAGLTKTVATQVVDLFFETFMATMVAGEEVDISRFGKFHVKERKARMGRDPKTGNALQIAASRAVGFKPAKALKDAVNGKR